MVNDVIRSGDMVVDGANGADTGNCYTCNQANTSGTWSTDLTNGYWTLIIIKSCGIDQDVGKSAGEVGGPRH